VSDRIGLHGLRARGRHGALPAERDLGQWFVVDVDLGVDTRPAALDDDLMKTVDYGTLADRITAVVEGDACDLIETLAQRIADTCLSDPLATDVRVTVHKPQAPLAVPFDDVTVTIRRSRT
jgi:dihydroneopterin aldolase